MEGGEGEKNSLQGEREGGAKSPGSASPWTRTLEGGVRAVSCGLAPSHHHGSGEVTCPVSATWVPPAPRGVLVFGLPSTKTSRFWTGGEFNEVGGAAGLLSHPFGAEARPSAGAAACSLGWSRVGGTQGGRNAPPRWSGKSPRRESRAENTEESRELEADQRLGWGRASSSERHHQAQLGGMGTLRLNVAPSPSGRDGEVGAASGLLQEGCFSSSTTI